MIIERITHSADETRDLGMALGAASQPGLVIALSGGLGAGKTALTQGIAAGLGVTTAVTSPTFTLVNRYDAGPVELVHLDCYRLGEAPSVAMREATTIGIEDLLADKTTILVIEWAELLADLLPDDHLAVILEPLAEDEQARRLRFTAHGPLSKHALAALAQAPAGPAAPPTK
jgi:tRNA threonylcarbamoyladenosine biosynthesis protein TsaE